MSKPRDDEDVLRHMSLDLTDGLTFLTIGDRKAVFSEPLQRIYEVNHLTAYLIGRVMDKTTVSELQDEVVERGLDRLSAKAVLHQFMLDWSRDRHLKISVPPADLENGALINLTVAGSRFALHGSNETLVKRVREVFGQFATPHDPSAQLCHVIERDDIAFVCAGDQPGYAVRPAQIVPALKGVMTDVIMANQRDSLLLHCATLIHDDKAYLLSGKPGAGKTILTLALISQGFEYAGDDIVRLDRNATVSAVPFLPALKEEAWPMANNIGIAADSLPTHLRLDGIKVRYAPVPVRHTETPVPVAAIIELSRAENRQPAIESVDVADALKHLVSGASAAQQRLTAAQLQYLNETCSAADRVTLHYADAREAAARLHERYRTHA